MKRGLSDCGEYGCPGHATFAETCSTIVVQIEDYPGLKPFQDALFMTEP